MRKLTVCIFILLLLVGCSNQDSQTTNSENTPKPNSETLAADASFVSEEWYDRYDIFEVNSEPAHASIWPYSSKEEGLAAEKSSLDDLDYLSSPYVQSLNGTWQFYYAKKPTERLKNIAGFDAFSYWEDWDDTQFETIEVPSNIQTQRNEDGTFKYESPIYINQIYPWINNEVIQYGWQGEPLAPTAFNSVGHYKREFELNDSMEGRNIFVSFKGVESAFYVYINGQRVGYSEDSYSTRDFNITPYLKKGKNTIAVEVYRWSTGSYFENQDFIRLSGIFRDVILYSKDDVEIRDLFVTSSIASDYESATLNIETSIRNLATEIKEGYSLSVDIYDGEQLVSNKSNKKEVGMLPSFETVKDEGLLVMQQVEISKPKLWSSEKPNLYHVLIQLFDEKGNVVETVCTRVGIRKVEVKQIEGVSQILVNDKPIILKGINRHETSLNNGRAITKEEIIQDLFMMKSYNINAFRTSHYPNQELTYDVADEIGLYIVDEANIESHIGENELSVPGNNPIYVPLILDRTKSMVERDKNHASILFWSLGNESTYNEYPMDENYPFYVTSRWILSRDPGRLRVYERDNRIGNTREESMVDVVSTQYWTLDQVNEYGKNNKNAFFQSEYGHAMGNALGNFKEYYDVYRSYPNIQGGFIWDFIDQSILTVDENGNEFYGHGGDWGTELHDGDFCGNGIISANRKPQAESEEVKKVQQDFQFSFKDNILTVTNESIDTNLNEFMVSVELLNDGYSVYKEDLEQSQLNVEALTTKDIPLSLSTLKTLTGEVILNVYVKYPKDQVWANEYGGKKGDIHSKEQFILKVNQNELQQEENKPIVVNEKENFIEISGYKFTVKIDKGTGTITDYTYLGETFLENGPYVSFGRAPVSNDLEFSPEVMNAESTANLVSLSLSYTDTKAIIKCQSIIESTNSKVNTTYTVSGDGSILIESKIDVPTIKAVGEIARVGVVFNLTKSVKSYEMYGRGPFENYSDRNTAAFVGIYSGSLLNWFNSTQLKPQDSGNKTDVRWFDIKGSKGSLRFISDVNLAVNVLPYLDIDIANAKHMFELEERDAPILHLDVHQRGLGNGSWGAEPLANYKIKQGQTITMNLLITPK